MKISVVMSCYINDQLRWVVESVESIQAQTVSFHELIIVADGALQEEVKKYFLEQSSLDKRIIFIQKDQNSGTGHARNIGMQRVTGDVIAIMDADDIAVPTRFEKQLHALEKHNVDVVWGWQEEFYDQSNDFAGIKQSKEFHNEIVRELKWRNRLPDPLTFMKRDCFEKTKGYSEHGVFGIDYLFFLFMLQRGFKFYCIQEALIKVRVSSEQRKRRGGLGIFKQDIIIRNFLFKHGLINSFEYISSLFLYGGIRFLPNGLRDLIYRKVFRRK